MRVFNLAEELEKERKKNKKLQEKIDMYENPDDMVLMFMWCDEKAKDKIKQLQDRIDKATEYIETLEKREAYKIVDNENGVPSLVVDNEEYLVLCKYNKLLDILKGE